MPWPMSKNTPRVFRREDFGADVAGRAHRRMRPGVEAVGEDVAGAQHLHDLLRVGRAHVDMRHQRQAGAIGDLHRDLERGDAGGAAGLAADVRLDADDDVAIGLDGVDAFAGMDQAHVAAFADHDAFLSRSRDAGEGNVHISENARGDRLDDMAAEAGEVAGAGAAGVDGAETPERRAIDLGIDAERRGAAPVHMVAADRSGPA